MLRYSSQVSWILIVAFALSLLYELYRSTAKNGTSKYDSMRSFLTQGLPFYALAFALAVLVRTGWPWVAWTTLAVGIALISVSIFYYSTIVLPQRKPGPIDCSRTSSTQACYSSRPPLSPTTYSGRRWPPSESCQTTQRVTIGGRTIPPCGACWPRPRTDHASASR